MTAETEAKNLEEKKEIVKLEQTMQNELKIGHFVNAAIIAFKLKRPQTIYKIIQNMSSHDIVNFIDGLVESPEGLTALLTHIRDWNCFKKYSSMAQKLLFEVFERIPFNQFPEAKDLLNGIITYSNKHFNRAQKLYMDSFLVEHLLNEIALMPSKNICVEDSVNKKPRLGIS